MHNMNCTNMLFDGNENCLMKEAIANIRMDRFHIYYITIEF